MVRGKHDGKAHEIQEAVVARISASDLRYIPKILDVPGPSVTKCCELREVAGSGCEVVAVSDMFLSRCGLGEWRREG